MAVERIHWEDLPAETRRAVEQHTGTVWSAKTVPEGLNSAVAAILSTEAGPVFLKGLHRDYPRRWTQDREAAINPYTYHISPRLLWRIQGEWDLLGFELVEGEHADYRPGSADLGQVSATMTTLGEMTCPDVPVKRAEDRWRSYVDTRTSWPGWRVTGSFTPTTTRLTYSRLTDERCLLIGAGLPEEPVGSIRCASYFGL